MSTERPHSPAPPRWDESVAREMAAARPAGVAAELACLVYASRLLGGDTSLVIHGGGNTSVKTRVESAGGTSIDVLWVKGSGRDLATAQAGDFAPLDLVRLRRLESEVADPITGRPWISDIEPALMAARLDARAPFPSVESLLHAFLPARFVLHTHAESVLVLANQHEGEEWLRALLGPSIAVLPYARPGLDLARAVAAAVREHPQARAAVVRHHGIFTWGDEAREAYETMADAVTLCANEAAARSAGVPLTTPRLEAARQPLPNFERAARIAPVIRGALSCPAELAGTPFPRRMILAYHGDAATRALVDDAALFDRAPRALITPDHLIRTRAWPLVLETGDDDSLEDLSHRIRGLIGRFAARVLDYARRYDPQLDLTQLELLPRVVLVPGVGLFAAGPTRREADISADIALRSLALCAQGDAIGRYQPPAEDDCAAMEYWPLERAKLRLEGRPPLSGRVALVTGAAGAIGSGVALALARAGAVVVLSDRPTDDVRARLAIVRARIDAVVGPGEALVCPFDVSDPEAAERAFRESSLDAGGVDLLVLSHGMAEVGDIADLAPERVRQVFDVNALGSFHVLGAFVRQVRAEGTGGDVILISTKNVPEPGASFAAYSASKAAAHQLGRVAAIELAPLDVRVNMVSPDAVFGDEEVPSQLWLDVGAKRARSRGFDPAELPERYRLRNLLRTSVTVEHCAEAVLFFAERRTPTTGAIIPVDGGLPGAFPR